MNEWKSTVECCVRVPFFVRKDWKFSPRARHFWILPVVFSLMLLHNNNNNHGSVVHYMHTDKDSTKNGTLFLVCETRSWIESSHE
jgi:hypothetical protein